MLKENDFGIIQKWYESILKLQINAIVFHNSFSKDTVEKYSNACIQFVEVFYDDKLKPNVFRYFIYQNYLKLNSKKILNLFVTDIADVEVLTNPFESNLFKENSDYLFCGDEPEILDNDWMRKHCGHLRNLIPEYSLFEDLNKQQTLLNCGVIGGKFAVMQKLIDQIVEIHKTISFTNTTNYTLDMGVFNFVARTIFSQKILHGNPVNTVFKKYETQGSDCWFRHK